MIDMCTLCVEKQPKEVKDVIKGANRSRVIAHLEWSVDDELELEDNQETNGVASRLETDMIDLRVPSKRKSSSKKNTAHKVKRSPDKCPRRQTAKIKKIGDHEALSSQLLTSGEW